MHNVWHQDLLDAGLIRLELLFSLHIRLARYHIVLKSGLQLMSGFQEYFHETFLIPPSSSSLSFLAARILHRNHDPESVSPQNRLESVNGIQAYDERFERMRKLVASILGGRGRNVN
jgi:hypothetical protein